jgi:hypothetical protein
MDVTAKTYPSKLSDEASKAKKKKCCISLFNCSSTTGLLGGKYFIEKPPNRKPGKQMWNKINAYFYSHLNKT